MTYTTEDFVRRAILDPSFEFPPALVSTGSGPGDRRGERRLSAVEAVAEAKSTEGGMRNGLTDEQIAVVVDHLQQKDRRRFRNSTWTNQRKRGTRLPPQRAVQCA